MPLPAYKKRLINSRPYLSENVRGDKFTLTGFIALLTFIGVLALWVYSARGIFGGVGRFIGISNVQIDNSDPSYTSQPSLPFVVTVEPPAVIVNVPPQPTLPPLPTYTPYPTSTPYPTPTPVVGLPNVIMVYPAGSAPPADMQLGERIKVRVSHYWPPFGGINCDKLPDGSEECIHLADGSDFRDFVGGVVACPAEWPFGSRVLVGGGWYECRDRGGAIVIDPDGTAWIDILYPYNPLGPWGAVYDAVLVKP